jgi:geranylgeranylglycerol-phosphate geranylgeranyltransferase
MARRPLSRALIAHLETWRPYGLTYVGLVGLAGASLAAPHPDGWRLLGGWGIPTLGWLAGLYGGDFFDRELDAVAKPQRPIPSGRMSARTALAAMVVSVSAGAVFGLLLNWRTILLVAAALAAGVSYSTWFKARGLSGNLVRGGITACAFLFGTMMTSAYPPVRLLPLALLFWLHDAGSNLVGTLRDVDGDRAGGYRTLPVRSGVSAALACASVLYALWLLIALVAPVLLPRRGNPGFYWPLLGAGAVLGASALLVITLAARPLPPRTALRAHEILVIERVVLGGALVALGAARPYAVLPLLAVVLLVTWTSQHLMRARYEFASPLMTPSGRFSKVVGS